MKIVNTTRIGIAMSIAVLFFLSACATTLAPNYDKAIVDGLVSTNAKLMEHFSSTSSGTTKETYDKREKTYNAIIGSLDGLAIQARSRPVPKNKITKKANEYLQKRGVAIIDDDAPSATALQKISETIVKMRDTDKKQGVTSFEVSAFKGQAVIYLDQALTYESFLER